MNLVGARTTFGSVLFGLVFTGVLSRPMPSHPGEQSLHPPSLVLGNFDDDYGGRHAITVIEWQHGKNARYRIVKWNAAEQYLIAQNDAKNPSDPGLWSRFDWMPLDNMAPFTWAFCMSAYKAPSAEAAEATTIAKREMPKTGCSGFPFTRMRRGSGVP